MGVESNRIRPVNPAGIVPMGDFKRAGGFAGLRRLISSSGGEPSKILARFGVAAQVFDDSEAYVSYPKMVRVLEYCALEFKEPFFGFKIGREQAVEAIGPLAPLLFSASTLAQGLNLVERYMAVHAPGARLELSRSGSLARLSYEVLDRTSTGSRQINELSMAAAFNILRMIANGSFGMERVEIASAKPSVDYTLLEKFFGAPLEYEQPVSALCFDAEFLKQRIDTGNPTLLRFAQDQCETLYPEEPEIEKIVAAHIRRLMPMGACTLEIVARQLSIHPRSLQNRLVEAGSEFRQILKEQRKDMARAYLAQSRTPIAEVATLLGYSDQATFTRAFANWFGTSPKRFRTAHQSQGRLTDKSPSALPGQLTPDG